MTNRLAVALAVTAGYVLGRTKKAKLAIGVGSMVLGKRLNLSPQQLVGTLTEQLRANPQLAEVRDQLRTDLQGVGKAATSALVTRQLNSLADHLHGRTLDVRDRIDTGKLTGGLVDDDEDTADDKPADDAYEARGGDRAGKDASGGSEDPEAPRRRRPAKKTERTGGKSGTGSDGSRPDGSGSRKTAAKKAPSGKAPAKKTAGSAARKAGPAAKKTAGTARRATGRRTGGGDRD
ncbi:DNA primase [Streptomyces sp. NPDC001922]|uniref:DNA primase n=1 Tax=Streptomyces sp. NPDC001922 TaxID=3364624 RepID=UPI00368594D0